MDKATNNKTSKVDKKPLSIETAVSELKKFPSKKFNETIDVVFSLNIDTKKPEHQLKGTISLPHSCLKKQKIVAVVAPDEIDIAKDAGADIVGGSDIIEKILQTKWTDFDVLLASNKMVGSLAKAGHILGPKGLMPTIKKQTVSNNIEKTIKEFVKGKKSYQVDKQGNFHFIIGKKSFSDEQIIENFNHVLKVVNTIKPQGIKSNYIKSIAISATMSPSILIQMD
ncbi:50S ribosomal protein L1 [Mycoplasma sp. SG1]|uniref:50S ribosomal protein L1 n=1 Tax=Mycoplasma sp. SG1 TaxID=2810348 RepID=UPI002023D9CD|nr:50S ribosomal protein L1 [Mycoplasma sp. SG1]URM52880.1 50S ribosomal protein L1 [Mycoplasma sp. SG1]